MKVKMIAVLPPSFFFLRLLLLLDLANLNSDILAPKNNSTQYFFPFVFASLGNGVEERVILSVIHHH
jgi:hypothetical protein